MVATIRDVAEAAGVSPSTVSRALTDSELVNPVTRDRVRRAATRLGYQPNRAARGLITGRTHNIGLIVPDLANPFFPGVVKGVRARAHEADFAMFVADTDEDEGAEARLARTLAKQVDGLILCSTRMKDEDLRALSSDITVVLMNRRAVDLPALTVDNVGGMRQAVSHLAALGHRRVAYIAGPANSWSSRERVRGLPPAAEAAGVELVELGDFPPHFGSGVAAADLALAKGVTAVMAYNDVVALGLLNRFSTRGVSVPEQMSVVGCDDITLSAMCSPSLTTIALPQKQAGRAAVDLLLSVLDEEDRANTSLDVELETQLVVRASTGPAPGF
ncbi:LacI family DNA-binding transcriptional regulator [Phytoactinopolyspora endophytica]|uniref:LacI family DNA-binding transcriptional regulator n=1 Tax=Phytoactinopolyspora endophytica TaxID=1642495 RepID=UPI00101C43CB|nr:LacI family DNA-binding transcriptional regulator [Phytoactinopolyspora endophytica]